MLCLTLQGGGAKSRDTLHCCAFLTKPQSDANRGQLESQSAGQLIVPILPCGCLTSKRFAKFPVKIQGSTRATYGKESENSDAKTENPTMDRRSIALWRLRGDPERPCHCPIG
jgi:hypothetical protein